MTLSLWTKNFAGLPASGPTRRLMIGDWYGLLNDKDRTMHQGESIILRCYVILIMGLHHSFLQRWRRTKLLIGVMPTIRWCDDYNKSSGSTSTSTSTSGSPNFNIWKRRWQLVGPRRCTFNDRMTLATIEQLSHTSALSAPALSCSAFLIPWTIDRPAAFSALIFLFCFFEFPFSP